MVVSHELGKDIMQIPTLKVCIIPFVDAYRSILRSWGTNDDRLWDQTSMALDVAADAMQTADRAPGPRRLKMLFSRLAGFLHVVDPGGSYPAGVTIHIGERNSKLLLTARRAADTHPEAAAVLQAWDETLDRFRKVGIMEDDMNLMITRLWMADPTRGTPAWETIETLRRSTPGGRLWLAMQEA